MDKEQKQAAVAELTEDLKGAESVFAIDYRGISVTGSAELRRRLAEADAVFRVVKNRLAKRAVAEAGTEELDQLLVGPTALTLIHGDAVIAAKAISGFARESGVLQFKGGLMDGDPVDPETFAELARLPGLEALRGQLVGVASSPITGLVRGLGSMMSGLAVALGQIAEQGLVGGDEPAPAEEPEAAAEEPEAPAEEPEAAAEEPAAQETTGEAEQLAAEETSPDEEAPTEESAPEQPEQPAAEPESELPAEAAEAEQSSDDESQPEEPAADAEAEGSEE